MVLNPNSAPASSSSFPLSALPHSVLPPVPPPPHPARPNHRKRISQWTHSISASLPGDVPVHRSSVLFRDTLNARYVQEEEPASDNTTSYRNTTVFDTPSMSSLLRKRRQGKDRSKPAQEGLLHSKSTPHLPLPDSFIPSSPPKTPSKYRTSRRPSTSHGESSSSTRPSADDPRAAARQGTAFPHNKPPANSGGSGPNNNNGGSLFRKVTKQRSLGNLIQGRSSGEHSDSTVTSTLASPTFSRLGHSPQSSVSSVLEGLEAAPVSGKRWSREEGLSTRKGAEDIDDRRSTFQERPFFKIGRDGMTRYHPYSDYNVPYSLPYDDATLENERYTTMLLRRLTPNHGPSFHDYGDKPPARVLDLGCGRGDWIVDSAGSWPNTKFTGLDLVRLAEDCWELGDSVINNISWVQHDFLHYRLPFPDNSFDFIRLANLTLAIPAIEWRRLFVEVERVLAPDGRMELIDDELFFPYMDLPAPPLAPVPRNSTTPVNANKRISTIDRDLDPSFDNEDEDDEDAYDGIIAARRPSANDSCLDYYFDSSDSHASFNSSEDSKQTDTEAKRQSYSSSDSSDTSLGRKDSQGEFDRSLELAHALEALHAAALNEKYNIQPHPSDYNRIMTERALVVAFGRDCVRKSKDRRVCLPSKEWFEEMGVDAFLKEKEKEKGKNSNWPLFTVEWDTKKDREKDEFSTVKSNKGSTRSRKFSELMGSDGFVASATTTAAFGLPLSTSPPSFSPHLPSSPPSNASTQSFHAMHAYTPPHHSPLASSNKPLPSIPGSTPLPSTMSAKAAKLLGAPMPPPAPTPASPPKKPVFSAPFYAPPYQPNGLVLFPDVFMPMDEEELEMHVRRNLQVVLSSGRLLEEFVREKVEKEAQREAEAEIMTEQEKEAIREMQREQALEREESEPEVEKEMPNEGVKVMKERWSVKEEIEELRDMLGEYGAFERRRFNWPLHPSWQWKDRAKDENLHAHKRDRTVDESSSSRSGTFTSRGRSDSKSGNSKTAIPTPHWQEIQVENPKKSEKGLICVRSFRVFQVHKAALEE